MDLTRQTDIIHRNKLCTPCTVVGAGAIGSFVALTLAKMGIPRIDIFDKDIVEEENLPNQWFKLDAIGKKKAYETERLIKQFSDSTIFGHARNLEPENFGKLKEFIHPIVVSCVDSMKVRKEILDFLKKKIEHKLFIDARMAGQVINVLTINPKLNSDVWFYEQHWYSDSEAVQERCTEKAIIYTSTIAAGLICNQVKKFLNGEKLNREIIFDAQTLEFIIEEDISPETPAQTPEIPDYEVEENEVYQE